MMSSTSKVVVEAEEVAMAEGEKAQMSYLCSPNQQQSWNYLVRSYWHGQHQEQEQAREQAAHREQQQKQK
jgi:hypothetical protein